MQYININVPKVKQQTFGTFYLTSKPKYLYKICFERKTNLSQKRFEHKTKIHILSNNITPKPLHDNKPHVFS